MVPEYDRASVRGRVQISLLSMLRDDARCRLEEGLCRASPRCFALHRQELRTLSFQKNKARLSHSTSRVELYIPSQVQATQ